MARPALEQLQAALLALGEDIAGRVEELATRSTAGVLTPLEQEEYAEIVRINDLLSLLKLQTERARFLRAS